MPSQKSLGKRRAVDPVPTPSDADASPSLSPPLLPSTSTSHGPFTAAAAADASTSRAESPMDPSALLQQPVPSPEHTEHTEPAQDEAEAEAELDEEEDDDVVVVANQHQQREQQPEQESRKSKEELKSARFYEMSCPICMDSPRLLVVSSCGHTFCGTCLFSALSHQKTSDVYMNMHNPVTRNNLLKASKGELVDGGCPVCRKDLKDGWGSAARGLKWKVGRAKKRRRTTTAEGEGQG